MGIDVSFNFNSSVDVCKKTMKKIISTILITKQLPESYVIKEIRGYKNKNINNSGKDLGHLIAVRDFDHVNRLIKGGELPLNDPDNDVIDPMFSVIRYGDSEWLEKFIEWGGDISRTNPTGNTYLHYSVIFKNIDAVKWILGSNCIDINCVNYFNETPLSQATSSGYVKIADLLLSHGAATEINSNEGKSLLHCLPLNNSCYFIEKFYLVGVTLIIKIFMVTPHYSHKRKKEI